MKSATVEGSREDIVHMRHLVRSRVATTSLAVAKNSLPQRVPGVQHGEQGVKVYCMQVFK